MRFEIPYGPLSRFLWQGRLNVVGCFRGHCGGIWAFVDGDASRWLFAMSGAAKNIGVWSGSASVSVVGLARCLMEADR